MPFINAEPELGNRRQIPKPVESPEVSTLETFQAAAALHTSIGSLIDRGPQYDYELTPLSPELRLGADEYDPFDDIKDYEEYAGSFSDVDSVQQADQVKRNIDRERKNKATEEASGAMGTAAMFAVLSRPIQPSLIRQPTIRLFHSLKSRRSSLIRVVP